MGRVFWGSSVIKQRCVNVSFLPCSENSSVQVKRKRFLGQYLGQGVTVFGKPHLGVLCQLLGPQLCSSGRTACLALR